jgi:dihydropteroate synthase
MSAVPLVNPFPRYASRASQWQLRTRSLQLPPRCLLMGIVNVTPDSFSDGGKFFHPDEAVSHALRLVEEGADLLDIGGESTRPYSDPVSLKEELDRVVPVISALVEKTDIPISIDTSKAAVARECLRCGAEIINDVTGLSGDPEMVPLAAESGAGVCVMHMQGIPKTMQDSPSYNNVVEDVLRYLRQRRDDLVAAGVAPQRLCLDPGIGFGKTQQHNLSLLCEIGRGHELGCPLLVGPSKKGFIAKVLGSETADRTAATVGVALALAARGVQVIRLHEIQVVRQALLLYEAAGGLPTG